MKLLVCTFYQYYGDPRSVEPQFYYLYRVPQTMGHEVDFFDYRVAWAIDPQHMRRAFLALVKGGGYDAVFIATHEEEFDQATLQAAGRYCPIIAWNSDDEWRWNEYSSRRADWFTHMVTNSPVVFESQRRQHSNLLHAQWACTGFWDGAETPKDIAFSFAGLLHGTRREQVQALQRETPLQVFGKGSGYIGAEPYPTGLRRWRRQLKNRLLTALAPDYFYEKSTVSFEAVNAIWNRSKLSYTPSENSRGGTMQVKSRVFDMGLSGTLMLAPEGAGIERYYEPGKEFVSYRSLTDCADKVKYFLQHEDERAAIAQAYRVRTLKENMWSQRIEHVLAAAKISGRPAARSPQLSAPSPIQDMTL